MSGPSPKRRRMSRVLERWRLAKEQNYLPPATGGIKTTDLDEIMRFAQAVLEDGTLTSIGGEDVS